jgi:hypothetical protein
VTSTPTGPMSSPADSAPPPRSAPDSPSPGMRPAAPRPRSSRWPSPASHPSIPPPGLDRTSSAHAQFYALSSDGLKEAWLAASS